MEIDGCQGTDCCICRLEATSVYSPSVRSMSTDTAAASIPLKSSRNNKVVSEEGAPDIHGKAYGG